MIQALNWAYRNAAAKHFDGNASSRYCGRRLLKDAALEQGFTLIEVMVALFVFAVGVTSLIVAQTQNIDATASLENRLMAEIVAENQLVETLTSPQELSIGFTYGAAQQGERAFRWSRQIRPTGQEGIVWVEINVHPEQPDDTSIVYSLSGFREQR